MKAFTLIKKELRLYFNSPIAVILLIFFLLFTSIWLFFIQRFLTQNVASLRSYFGIMPILFILIIPALTMRSWSEEKKTGTDELLVTLPFTELQLVLGKYTASLVLLALMLILTIPVPLTLSPLGNFEAGQIITEYAGIFLLGSAGIAIGQFLSSLSKNQISAFIFSALVLLAITLISQVASMADLPRWLAGFINFISLDFHFTSFKKGLLDSRDILYFLILIYLFLFLNVKVLIFKKWL